MIVDKYKRCCPRQRTGDTRLHFHSLGDAAQSSFPSWLMNGCNVSEGIKPLLKSLLASGVTRCWRGSQSTVGVCQSDMGVRCTRRPTHAHIHTYWQHTEATLPKLRGFGLWGKRQGICQMCTFSFRSVPPTIRCYWGWSAWLRVVYCTVGRCHWAG